MMQFHICLNYSYLYNSTGSEETQIPQFQQFWHQCKTPLKQSPLEGPIRFTKTNAPQTLGTEIALAAPFRRYQVVKEGCPPVHNVILFRGIKVTYKRLLTSSHFYYRSGLCFLLLF